MSLIEIRNLTKTYQFDGIKTEALRGVDLTIYKGDFIAIAGPSGSGKTSLLNIIGGLDRPTSGSAIFEGVDFAQKEPYELTNFRLEKIGFVFQAYNLFHQLSALENIEYVLMLQGMPAIERKQKANELLEHVGLLEYANKHPNKLSGGQQQRIAVLRAIASNPQIVLADEPTANLDSETALNLLELMRKLNQERKITFLFSTHDKLVMEKADKVYTLKDGRII